MDLEKDSTQIEAYKQKVRRLNLALAATWIALLCLVGFNIHLYWRLTSSSQEISPALTRVVTNIAVSMKHHTVPHTIVERLYVSVDNLCKLGSYILHCFNKFNKI